MKRLGYQLGSKTVLRKNAMPSMLVKSGSSCNYTTMQKTTIITSWRKNSSSLKNTNYKIEPLNTSLALKRSYSHGPKKTPEQLKQEEEQFQRDVAELPQLRKSHDEMENNIRQLLQERTELMTHLKTLKQEVDTLEADYQTALEEKKKVTHKRIYERLQTFINQKKDVLDRTKHLLNNATALYVAKQNEIAIVEKMKASLGDRIHQIEVKVDQKEKEKIQQQNQVSKTTERIVLAALLIVLGLIVYATIDHFIPHDDHSKKDHQPSTADATATPATTTTPAASAPSPAEAPQQAAPSSSSPTSTTTPSPITAPSSTTPQQPSAKQ